MVVQPQQVGGLFGQGNQQVDAHGHVGALEQGYLLSSLGQVLLGGLTQAGGADHGGHAALGAPVQHFVHGAGGGEIDYHIALYGQIGKAAHHGDGAVRGAQVHTGGNAAILPLADQLTQNLAHTAVDAMNYDIDHWRHFLFVFIHFLNV